MASDTIHLLLLYVVTELIACLTPGPAVLTVTSHALAGSRRGAAGAIAGINVGNLIWYALAGAGLSAVVAALPNLFTLLRWAGVGYLLWIGVQSWRQSDEGLALKPMREKTGFSRGLLSAAAVQLSNPKALLFFTVILPPFINPAEPILQQIIRLAVIGVVIEATILTVYATLAWRLGRYAASRATNRLINRTSGGLLILAALGIAATGRLKT
jgi:homoserine/homoserine lactone efflux protein